MDISSIALLVVITVVLILLLHRVARIDARLKERFPTEKEQDQDWAKKDPMGHWEAHKQDMK